MKNFASLTQITVFARIAELGSLSAAARELDISPSAVSKSLAQLEEHLGVLLVKRTTRSLTLTESGKIILEKANSIIADLDTALDAAKQFGRPDGLLKLTSSLAFGSKQLPLLLASYFERFPAVRANVALDDRCVDLAEEEYDIALRITAGTHWGHAARKLAPIHWVYCASGGYLDRHPEIRRPDDIYDHPCLVYPAMTLDKAWTFRKDNETHYVEVKARLTSNSSVALLEAALEGQGVACLPTYVAAKEISSGKLRIVLPEYKCAVVHTLYAMYYRSKYAKPLIRSFIDFIVEHYGEIPPWDRQLAPHFEPGR